MEPSAGRGAIVRQLRRHGLEVRASDLFDHGSEPGLGIEAVLLRWNWIAAKGRADLLKHCHAVIIAGRLKMLPPGALDLGHGATTDFAWFIMRREVVLATRLVRG